MALLVIKTVDNMYAPIPQQLCLTPINFSSKYFICFPMRTVRQDSQMIDITTEHENDVIFNKTLTESF